MFDFRPGGISTNDAVIVSKSIDTAVVKVTRQPQQLGEGRKGETDEKEEERERLPFDAFGGWQTILADPLPMNADGSLPVNAYGCFELFHSSLLPPGVLHVDHAKAKQAVSKLKLEKGREWAECLVGFEHQSPVLHGVVVKGIEQGRKVKELAEQMGQEEREEKDDKRKKRVIERWIQLVRGVLVQERVKREYGGKAEKGEEK